MPDFTSFFSGWYVLIVLILVFLVVVMVAVTVLTRRLHRLVQGRLLQAAAAAPEVQVQARVIGKRVESLGQRMNGGPNAVPSARTGLVRLADGTSSPCYLVGFEQSGGQRFELEVPTALYGVIAEGDQGTLTMKGSRLLAFDRETLR